ncbi:MAG: dTDP-glucose 4,6-dehydratase [Planctomycetota bacterium]|nr:dTDP-glucose 4,6-dehydratase [Planctomycetota bacterium]
MAYERLFVTGGAGFIGSAFVHNALAASPDAHVLTYDALTYAGHELNLEGADPARHRLVVGDVTDAQAVHAAIEAFAPEAVVHVAAETHVDKSLQDPYVFLRTNVTGTQVLLDACHAHGIRMLLVSTDEVYGDLPHPERATPETHLRPSNAYAASKAAADLLALVAVKTRDQDVILVRCTNNYGPRQLPEKLIPLMILRAAAGESLPVYGDGRQEREWLHVEDCARGLWRALQAGQAGAVHHLAGGAHRANLDVVRAIVDGVGADAAQITHVADRPAHDRRYALDDHASREALAWAPRVAFDDGLAATIEWYQANEAWCRAVASEALAAFLARNYGNRTELGPSA